MWRLLYSLEAATYIADNWGLINELVTALKSLRHIVDANSPEHVKSESGIYVWGVAGHRVYYALVHERNLINILVIKPLE